MATAAAKQTYTATDTQNEEWEVANCERLWENVLTLAAQDLCRPVWGPLTNNERALSAIVFLFSGDGDDRIEFAGKNPAVIRNQVIEQVINGVYVRDRNYKQANFRNARRNLALYYIARGVLADDIRPKFMEHAIKWIPEAYE